MTTYISSNRNAACGGSWRAALLKISRWRPVFRLPFFLFLLYLPHHASAQDSGKGAAPAREMPTAVQADPFGFRSKAERIKALEKYGGDASTEDAVLKALRWFKSIQNPDGSWGMSYRSGITGIVLLAFLGHGETPMSEEFGKSVSGSIAYLEKQFAANGGSFVQKNFGNEGYEHAIATFAVCEAYGMTRDPKLYPVMNGAVKRVIEGQRGEGGWDYRYGESARRDLSVGGWNMQALNAARSASADAPSIQEAMRKAVKDTKKHWDKSTGMFTYSNETAPGRPTLTGVGALCVIELDGTDSAEFKGAMRYLVKNARIDWRQMQPYSIYSWYYQTLTFFKSEQNWKNWNPQMKKELVENQDDDGHWEESVGGRPSNDQEMDVLNTALCCLMLEVYYRYFTVSVEKERGGGGSSATKGGEVDDEAPLSTGRSSEKPPEGKIEYKGIPY